MEEPTQTPIESVQEKTPSKTRTKPILLTLLAVVLVAAAAAGSYFWQHSKVNDLNAQVQSLRAQSAAKTTSPTPTPSKVTPASDMFTYKPKTGGLTLVLPTKYGVIVNVDGNAGGAPGAIFRVASTVDANQFADALYQGVQVDVSNTFKDLNRAVESAESTLDSERSAGSTVNRNYKVSDTTVAGLPAKLLTADGLDEYQGKVSVYLVGSGSFLYKVTANGPQDSAFPLLDAVLKGMSIKPVTL